MDQKTEECSGVALSYVVTSDHTWLLRCGRSEIHIEFRRLSIEIRVTFFH